MTWKEEVVQDVKAVRDMFHDQSGKAHSKFIVAGSKLTIELIAPELEAEFLSNTPRFSFNL
jgi:hypothetical protein